ncbi:MAG TPA: hypothetical protein VMG30_06195 [Acidobacteriota bacterium]|nr:hypothetical protein [Acidobacteriota bacterium]
MPEFFYGDLKPFLTGDILEKYSIVDEGDLAVAAAKLETFESHSADKDTNKARAFKRKWRRQVVDLIGGRYRI